MVVQLMGQILVFFVYYCFVIFSKILSIWWTDTETNEWIVWTEHKSFYIIYSVNPTKTMNNKMTSLKRWWLDYWWLGIKWNTVGQININILTIPFWLTRFYLDNILDESNYAADDGVHILFQFSMLVFCNIKNNKSLQGIKLNRGSFLRSSFLIDLYFKNVTALPKSTHDSGIYFFFKFYYYYYYKKIQ